MDSGGDSKGGREVGDRGIGQGKVLHTPCRTGWLVTQGHSAVPLLVSSDQLACFFFFLLLFFFCVLIQEIISFSLVSMETSL